MRTVRISWKKFVVFLLLCGLAYYIIGPFVLPQSIDEFNIVAGKPLSRKGTKVGTQKTVYKTDGALGNFEKYESPRKGPGEMGKSHRLKPEQRAEEDRLKSVYGFNQLVSDEISLDRTVPDMREKECKHWDYPEDLPTASIIFIFHNEGWSTLLRSVHSVINRSPARFLHEIVLVDDKSELLHLHEPLEEELKKPFYQGKVKLVRNKEREGLIRARNNGAIAATGDVVVFLDAHCEVGVNWLPPLLAPIYDNPKTLTVPVIDGIQWDDFSINPVYAEGSHSRGIFEWGMLYKEGPLPPKEANKRSHHSEPYNSPTHAGGLFAIRRDWFKQLGWYDPGLLIWGGENYELSFKLWQCGGRSLWVPCSRVGHVYRGHSCASCHSGDMGKKWGNYPLTLRNYKRLIEVWFDDKYKEFFYTREPLARFVDHGDISEQLALKKRMNCKSFTWFMKEVAYDVLDKYPELPPNKFWGELKNHANNQCIDTYSRSPPGTIGISSCHGWGGNQMFRLNTQGQLSSGEWCVEYHQTKDHTESQFIMSWCKPGATDGTWSFDEANGFLKNGDKCVLVHPKSLKLVAATCDKNNNNHRWMFRNIKPRWRKNED